MSVTQIIILINTIKTHLKWSLLILEFPKIKKKKWESNNPLCCSSETPHTCLSQMYFLNVYIVVKKGRNRKQVDYCQQYVSVLCFSSWYLLMSLLSSRDGSTLTIHYTKNLFYFVYMCDRIFFYMWAMSLEVRF